MSVGVVVPSVGGLVRPEVSTTFAPARTSNLLKLCVPSIVTTVVLPEIATAFPSHSVFVAEIEPLAVIRLSTAAIVAVMGSDFVPPPAAVATAVMVLVFGADGVVHVAS